VLDEIARLNESRAKQSMLSALLSKSRDAEETTRLRVKLRAAYERFMVRRSLAHWSKYVTISGQVAAQIRHNIALASVAEAQARSEQSISEGHSRHDAALDAITASQTRHDHILPTLLSDADRGMFPCCHVSGGMLIPVRRGSEVFVPHSFCPSQLEHGTTWLP
jgi:hypothetical protein